MEGETKGRMREERWQSRKRERLRKTQGYEEMEGEDIKLNWIHTQFWTHIFICQDTDIPDSEILQVHPDLPRDPLTIPDV